MIFFSRDHSIHYIAPLRTPGKDGSAGLFSKTDSIRDSRSKLQRKPLALGINVAVATTSGTWQNQSLERKHLGLVSRKHFSFLAESIETWRFLQWRSPVCAFPCNLDWNALCNFSDRKRGISRHRRLLKVSFRGRFTAFTCLHGPICLTTCWNSDAQQQTVLTFLRAPAIRRHGRVVAPLLCPSLVPGTLLLTTIHSSAHDVHRGIPGAWPLKSLDLVRVTTKLVPLKLHASWSAFNDHVLHKSLPQTDSFPKLRRELGMLVTTISGHCEWYKLLEENLTFQVGMPLTTPRNCATGWRKTVLSTTFNADIPTVCRSSLPTNGRQSDLDKHGVGAWPQAWHSRLCISNEINLAFDIGQVPWRNLQHVCSSCFVCSAECWRLGAQWCSHGKGVEIWCYWNLSCYDCFQWLFLWFFHRLQGTRRTLAVKGPPPLPLGEPAPHPEPITGPSCCTHVLDAATYVRPPLSRADEMPHCNTVTCIDHVSKQHSNVYVCICTSISICIYVYIMSMN